MKLTKQDYMRLPKERLAELLVEIESQKIELQKIELPLSPSSVWGCDGIHCTNPQMDCINCPRRMTYDVKTIATLKTEGKE